MEKVTVKELITKDIKGKVICFPTDTVYGVAASINDIEAIKRIYAMKKRDQQKPLAILTPSSDIENYVEHITPQARLWMQKRWPGAMTLIFLKSKRVSDEVTMGVKTIAFRMPASKVALSILEVFGPMAATSVNVSGEKELNSVEDIENQFKDCIDYLITDDEIMTKIPSAVIDVTEDDAKIIRA